MRRRDSWLVLLAAVTACGPPAAKTIRPAPETEIVLLYNCDDKGDYEECGCKDVRLGGLVRRATVIGDYRATHPNVLAVHGGGWALPSGKLESEKGQSLLHVEVMGALHYTALNVTPADLSYGVETLRQAALAAQVPLVASNLKFKSKDQYVFDPYRIVDVKGIRVAFLGVMAEGEALSPFASERDDLMTLPPADALRVLLPQVRSKADVVVVFTYLTQRQIRQLAADVRGIDVAVAGEDDFVNYRPTVVGDDSTGKTIILEAGDRGKYLGALAAVVNQHGKIVRFDHKLHALDHTVKDDSTTTRQVEAFKERLKEMRKHEAVDPAAGPNAAPAPAAPRDKSR